MANNPLGGIVLIKKIRSEKYAPRWAIGMLGYITKVNHRFPCYPIAGSVECCYHIRLLNGRTQWFFGDEVQVIG